MVAERFVMMRLFKLSLLKDFERESTADDYGFEDWNGRSDFNEEGRKYFENYLFDVKRLCRARDNYVYVLETLDEIEMKLDYWRRNNELSHISRTFGARPDIRTMQNGEKAAALSCDL
ncbi:Uncharacterised protein [Mannheimia haemolytica]|uniref:Uncharacterized protein n=1 Tax=Mannheimia haemolytica TaxID=75985 RepID=A0A378PTZ1_MANHA|nr:Uncharacterised protein [Mannheimia haemolytica]